jgi:hypothetical protein
MSLLLSKVVDDAWKADWRAIYERWERAKISSIEAHALMDAVRNSEWERFFGGPNALPQADGHG